MKSIIELARAFYGVVIPKKLQKKFLDHVLDYLDERYSIETAIGLALKEIRIQ
ncbi:MAG: hypothetical protein KKB34_03970 [Bacteroidetes bacterium]|jgi:hypothetical protein|nr:hypothetical protein [Bacteroidota bacterium]